MGDILAKLFIALSDERDAKEAEEGSGLWYNWEAVEGYALLLATAVGQVQGEIVYSEL